MGDNQFSIGLANIGALTSALLVLMLCQCSNHDKSKVDNARSEFVHKGLVREYIFHAPEHLRVGAPLVVVLHGFTSTAGRIRAYTDFDRIADEQGFAVVYPQGTIDKQSNTFWNVGYEFHTDSQIDDLEFLVELVKHLQQKHRLSKKNTFATGMSNGGEMCYLLACYFPDVFNAVAPVAGTMMSNHFAACEPTGQIPILAIVGTSDSTTNYFGDVDNLDGWGAYESIPDIISMWTSEFTHQEAEVDTLADIDTLDGSYVILSKFQGENPRDEFLYYEVVGGGHDWPGAWGNQDVSASAEIWKFFMRQLH